MKKDNNNSKTNNNHDDKYNINDKYDSVNSYSSTELTGLVRPAPANEEELDNLNDIFTFKTEDIVVDIEGNNKEEKEKSNKYKYL